MCRYAMSTYKPHFACFKCRKTFKRRLIVDIDRGKAYQKNYWQNIHIAAKCPECASLMANMGLDFEAPKKNDKKAWQHMENLYESGIAFHSCGCTGPGYIPKDKEKLLEYLNQRKADYIRHRRFWSNRIEPKTDSEKQKDWNKNSEFLCTVPYTLKTGSKNNRRVDIEKAVEYWTVKTNEIEEYIANLA